MTTNIEAAQRLQYHIDNDLLIRKSWTGEKDGRETACLLAAMVPKCGTEEAAEFCPAEVMPAWLAYMTPNIDDYGSEDAWPGMVRRYAACAARWHILDDDAWRRVKLATLRECLVIVLPHDASGVVAPVISLIDEGAPADDPRWGVTVEAAEAEAESEAAARAAASAAWAATRAAARAARTAVGAAVAGAAARTAWARVASAAETAAEAAETAAEAAETAAWDRITNALLTAIENECSKKEIQ